MNYILGVMLVVCVYLLSVGRPSLKDQWEAGYAAGKKEALKTNPPSQELEITCAGLWIGEQNRKYWNRENAGNTK